VRGRGARGRLVRGRLTHGRLTHGRLTHGRLARGRLVRGRLVRGRLVRGRLMRGRLTRNLAARLGLARRAKFAADRIGAACIAARLADCATMRDEQMRESAPICSCCSCCSCCSWEERHEILFNLDWIGLLGKRHALRQSSDMRVDDDALVDIECIAQHDIGRLACDAAQCKKLRHRRGHIAAVLQLDCLHRLADGSRFIAPEVHCFYKRLDVADGCSGEGGDSRKRAKECRRCLVDSDISGLRRENCGDEQLMRLGPIERAVCIRVSLDKSTEESLRAVPLPSRFFYR